MGYPMTYRRVVNRNYLGEGDYTTPSPRPLLNVNPDALPEWAQSDVKNARSRWSMLLGDLRRLERDATDEQATCKHIARLTGIDPETVAIVLKEFFQW